MELYKEYKEYYEEYKKYLIAQDKLIYKDGYFYLKDLNKKLKPPVIKNIFVEIEELKNRRRELLLNYKDIYDQILYTKEYKNEYNKIITEILDIDARIETLIQYFNLVNQIENKDEKLKKEIKQLRNQLIESITNKVLKKYLVKIDEYYKLIDKTVDTIDFYIVEKSILMDMDKKEPVIVEDKKQKNKLPIRKDQDILIKTNIKLLLAEKFKFKTKEECSTSKRSAQFYMTKDEIVKTIESTPELIDHMPKKYKSMKKEEICDHLFF